MRRLLSSLMAVVGFAVPASTAPIAFDNGAPDGGTFGLAPQYLFADDFIFPVDTVLTDVTLFKVRGGVQRVVNGAVSMSSVELSKGVGAGSVDHAIRPERSHFVCSMFWVVGQRRNAARVMG